MVEWEPAGLTPCKTMEVCITQLKSIISELWKLTKATEWAKTASIQEKLLDLNKTVESVMFCH